MMSWDAFLDVLHASLFLQMAGILIIAGIFGFLALKLHQPLIVAFIAAGILVSPGALGIAAEGASGSIGALANLGIALLLFMVGLKLDLKLIRTLGPVALIAGTLQIALTVVLGTALAAALGYGWGTAFLIGIALSFSSTIIVVKMLSDQRAIDSLHGKIALGILIIQDIVVILSLVTLAGFGMEAHKDSSVFTGDVFSAGTLAVIFVKVLALAGFTGFFIRYLADPLTRTLSRSPELTVIFAIGLTAILAGFAYSIGLSKELGGLLAGIALASTPIREELVSRLASVRDFLLLFFFVDLGSGLDLGAIGSDVTGALILSVFVLAGKPLIIMGLAIALGYKIRTGFTAGLTLGQISEFSLIFIAMAGSVGLAGQETTGLITLVALITFGLSTYGIMHAGAIYLFLEKIFGRLPWRVPLPLRYEEKIQDARIHKDYDIIVIGLGRYGLSIARRFKGEGYRVLGLDFDPQEIKTAQKHGLCAVYGDASNPDIADHLPLRTARAVICAFPHYEAGPLLPDLRVMLAKGLRNRGYAGIVAATSRARGNEPELEAQGVDLVLNPFQDAAARAFDDIDGALKAR